MIDIKQYKELCFDVVGAIHNVKRELGPGLNEKIYQEGLALELAMQNISFEREKIVHPVYRGKQMESTFYMDFFCKGAVIVELKSVSALNREHRAQLFNYMHLVNPQAGILVNFANTYTEVERYFYDSERNQILNTDGIPIQNRYYDIR